MKVRAQNMIQYNLRCNFIHLLFCLQTTHKHTLSPSCVFNLLVSPVLSWYSSRCQSVPVDEVWWRPKLTSLSGMETKYPYCFPFLYSSFHPLFSQSSLTCFSSFLLMIISILFFANFSISAFSLSSNCISASKISLTILRKRRTSFHPSYFLLLQPPAWH